MATWGWLRSTPHHSSNTTYCVARRHDQGTPRIGSSFTRCRSSPTSCAAGCHCRAATVDQARGDRVCSGRAGGDRALGAGYDKIDVEACTEHDVALFNVPLALNHATGSTALMFMLALAKRLPQQERLARRGRWDLQSVTMGSEIEGRTLGIIGLGHSGRELVRLAAPFGMTVLAYSPHADPAQAAASAYD